MDYTRALEQAVMYIETHLLEDIRVEDVARNTGYSYYHLTRQFSAMLGESVGSYIKKRRLADAAKQLLYTDRRIIDIALERGFESSEAFSRSFKALYRVSPALYRKNRLDLFIGSKPRLDAGGRLEHLTQNVTVHPAIVELPDIKVIGLRGQTTLHDNVLPDLWARFNQISHTIDNAAADARGFGICEACEEGNTLFHMNSDVLFSEIAGIEVHSFDRLTPPFVGKTLRGGKYAVFTHTGSLHRLADTFSYIWGTWFTTTRERIDFREDFELYDHRFLGYDHPQSKIDLCIPLR